MNDFRSSHRRWRRLEVAFVLVSFGALIVLQYMSNSRLARVGVIAHQTTLVHYLDAVAADVRRVYEDAAQEMLAVPGTLSPRSGSMPSRGTSTGRIRRRRGCCSPGRSRDACARRGTTTRRPAISLWAPILPPRPSSCASPRVCAWSGYSI